MTPLERIVAAAELVSPVSVSDVQDAKKLVQALGKFGGRKGGANTRAQNRAIADRVRANDGTVEGGLGGREQYFPGNGPGTKGSRYSDGTVRDANGRRAQVQTVNTKADGRPTNRETQAAQDIAKRSGDPVVCVSKKICR